ncbi:MAG: hypothetical protein WA057_02830 [Candidatus Magasanikiibacteriota bacterium]
MSKFAIAFVLAFLFVNPLLAEEKDSTATTSFPEGNCLGSVDAANWAFARLIRFNANPLYEGRRAFARPFAFGTVWVQDHSTDDWKVRMTFWFMWSNTDGLIQLCLSNELDLTQAYSIQGNVDLYDRPFEAEMYSEYCDGGYVAISNDFFMEEDDKPEEDDQKFVDSVWVRMNTLFPFFSSVKTAYLLK